jgi:hypothetical protein
VTLYIDTFISGIQKKKLNSNHIKTRHIYITSQATMASKTIRPSEINASDIKLSDPKALDKGCKMLYMNHKESSFVLQIPNMKCTWGLKKWEGKDGQPDKYNLDLSLGDIENNPALKEVFNKFKEIDEKLIDIGFANSQGWFNRKHEHRSSVEMVYTPIIKYSKDKDGKVTDKYPPTIRLQVPFRNDKFDINVYDTKRQAVDLDTVDLKGATVAAIIQFTGVWITKLGFGCSTRIIQLRVTPKPNSMKGYAFVEDPDRL